jgi:hypothetical protein
VSEWVRTMWTSDAAKAAFADQIRSASAAWLDVELISVARGLRGAALVFERPGLTERLSALGLERAVVSPDRVVVTPIRATAAIPNFVEAYRSRDDEYIGAALGFPSCCRTAFDETWNRLHLRDTTLRQAGGDLRVVSGVPEVNLLARWVGVRLVPHLPCSWHCAESITLARDWAHLWPTADLAFTSSLLQWPVQYSALHGVAIITWPVFRVVVPTDYTAREQRVEMIGTEYPEHAPKGTTFPFQPPAARFVSLSRRKSLEVSPYVLQQN